MDTHHFNLIAPTMILILKSALVVALFTISAHSNAGESSLIATESEVHSEESPVPSQNRYPSHRALDLVSNRCIDCHEIEIEFSHPVGVTPPASMSVPANLPLIDGKVTCITCHMPFGSDHSTEQMPQSQQFGFVVNGTEICTQCHDPNGFSVPDMHSRTTRKAHIDLGNDRHARSRHSRSSSPTAQWLDAQSDSCMSCHDGAMASSSGFDLMSSHDSIYTQSSSTDHPIGPYQLTNPSESDGSLKPSSMLDSRIRLINNHVGCNSCHSVYSPQNDLLVIPNERSQLCLECHEY